MATSADGSMSQQLSDDSAERQPQWREVRFEYSRGFPRLLEQSRASLLVSTYQAGKLAVVGVWGGALTFAFHNFERVMGIAVGPRRLAVGTRRQIYLLHAAHDLAARVAPVGTHDACWLTRSSHFTGNLHGHELAWGSDGLWIVNTLFSCLCTLDEGHSFVPRWRPPFVTELADQDRCHLNGLALQDGQPRYVTALAESNEPAGWRPTKATSGCLIDVPSGETIVRGLAMPHSPRLYEGRLWVLDSGKGRLSTVDPQSGRVEPVAELPGYTRGLAFCGQFAFVGLSKIRETAVFGGLPIGERREELRCGVGVVDLKSGQCVALLQFHSGVEEIFAVEVLSGALNPVLSGPSPEEDGRTDIWVVPPERDEKGRPEERESGRDGRSGTASQGLALADSRSFSPTLSLSPSTPPSLSSPAAALTAEGVRLHGQGRLGEALQRLRHAAELDPNSADIQNHLGNLHQSLGDQPAAVACYRRALELNPHFAPVHQNLGYLCASWGEPHEALRHFELAERWQPSPMNRVLTATLLPVIYDSVDEVATWRHRLEDQVQALVRDGVRIDTSATLVPTSFFFAYQGQNDREVMGNLARVYQGVECCQAARDGTWRPKGRRIKVGFLSAYFHNHTIGRLNLGRIARLSRTDFEVTVISPSQARDSMAEAFRRVGDRFVNVPRDVAQARSQIAELGLDILVFTDVGMDALTQTLSWSRMAPVQCVTWGHPDTTGSPAIDYFISSELLETAEADAHYTERLVRLANLGTYYERPQLSGPARQREFFGLDPTRHVYLCPQTLFKFHPDFDAVLAGILHRDPQGDLVLLEGRVPNWTRRLQQRWKKTLPDADQRVRFLAAQPHADFLHLLTLADVMLDPLHFGGGNTSYEALALGVPVVTLPSPYLRGRITQALYRKMGCSDQIAASPEDYMARAVHLAADPAYRHEVSRQIAASSHVLYEDLEEVRALEGFFQSL